MSLEVVINGPVAKAGSILSLSRARGTKVPNIEANIITVISETLTVILKAREGAKKKLYINKIPEQTNPLINPTDASFHNLGRIPADRL